jgi:hypothetical protein
VSRRVDDDFLSFEGGVQIRDDAYLPAGRVGFPPVWQGKRLRRRAIFSSLAERAGLELCGRRLLEGGPGSAGPLGSTGRDDDLAAGKRIDAEVDCQAPSWPRAAATRGPISSIGSGRISVEVRSELISSIVWR